jgi:hypothetical protein
LAACFYFFPSWTNSFSEGYDVGELWCFCSIIQCCFEFNDFMLSVHHYF